MLEVYRYLVFSGILLSRQLEKVSELMNNIIGFFFNHWILSIIFIMLLVAILTNEWSLRSFGLPSLSPLNAVDFINHSDATVFDVRPANAYQEAHILGSLNVPVAQFNQKLKNLEKYKDKPLIVTCNVGQEAAKAATLLKAQGFTQIFLLQGGLQAWRAAGLPLTKKS